MRKTFGNDFCHSSHGKTERMFTLNFGQEVVQNIAQNIGRFSQRSFSLKSLLMT